MSAGGRRGLGRLPVHHLMLGLLALGVYLPAAALLGGLGTLNSLCYGLLQRASGEGRRPDPRIVLVKLDDEALANPALPHWGPGVLARRAHARVVRELTAAGASVIAFDIAFVGESTPADDAQLRAALAKARSSVLVVEAKANASGGDSDRFLEPTPAIASAGSVRLASPVVRRFSATGQVFGVQMEQARSDGRTLNALAFECYKAARKKDDIAASFAYSTLGDRNTMGVWWPRAPLEAAFVSVPYREVWSGAWRRRGGDLFRGRTVLIGSFERFGHADVLSTPRGEVPGVLVHACALQTLLDGAWIRPASGPATWLLALSAGVLSLAAGLRVRPMPAVVSMLLVAAAVWLLCLTAFRERIWIGPAEPTLAAAVFGIVGLLGTSDSARRVVERYAGRHAADQLVRTGSVRARSQTATVFFADVREYTRLAESLAPAELMEVLNDHYRWMDAIVERHGGRVDKHIGDAMMAVFEGTRWDQGHAARALEGAKAMLREAERRQGPAAKIEFGIGIHTGDVHTAELGGLKREVGTVGDAVNVAARLEQSTRSLGVSVLISGPSAAAAGSSVALRALDPITLKGKSEPIPVFTLADTVVPWETESSQRGSGAAGEKLA